MDRKRLEGWTQIECYLGMTNKTVVLHGYPVRRMLGRVFAYSEELDAHRVKLESSAGLIVGAASERVET